MTLSFLSFFSSQQAPTSENNTIVKEVTIDIGEDMGDKHKEDVSIYFQTPTKFVLIGRIPPK